MNKDQVWQEGILMGKFVSNKDLQRGEGGEKKQRYRVRFLFSLSVLLVITLFGRLLYLQVFEGERQTLFAANNQVELVRTEAIRGVILDRDGELLARNVIVDYESEEVGREYPLKEAGASLIGYLSEATESELGCEQGLCVYNGMKLGRAGVERVFEQKLRGIEGGKIVERDVSGKNVREVSEIPSKSGESVTLAIDADLQKVMYEALGGRLGAAVALDMQGKVLGMVSSPSYDPNWFGDPEQVETLKEALADSKKQLFLNRAMQGAYPPGSVFKPLVIGAAITEGVLKDKEEIEDTGEITVGDYRYGNWYFDKYGSTEGMIDASAALARSNDVFFYRVGERLGASKLSEWAKMFGMGQATGIELPAESLGFLPSPLTKERLTGEPWFLGNTYHFSIGQGDLTATPLQVARMTLAVVTGRLCKVSILLSGESSCESLPISSEALAVVREGMTETCQPGGTGYPLFDLSPPALCKTGTAEHAEQVKSTKENPVWPHAWITAVYPAEEPEIVLAVFLEAAGEGSEQAGPVARVILDKWKEINNY